MRTLVSWSTGKDSAWLVHVLRQRGDIEVGGLLTTVNPEAQRVATHGVRTDVLAAQAAALDLPLRQVAIPSPCPNDVYERAMAEVAASAVADEFTHIAFGDLFLEDIRRYREKHLAKTELSPLFPLFGLDTTSLARDMVRAGLRARITCVNTRKLDRSFAGREFDTALLNDLPPDVDPCGERGEFHTCSYDGPMFSVPVPLVTGEAVERNGFVYTDVQLGESAPLLTGRER